MENKTVSINLILVGVILLLSLACKTSAFSPTNSETPISVDETKSQEAGVDIIPAEVPPPELGEIITTGDIEIFLPPEYQNEQPSITTKVVTDPLPSAPDESTLIGQAYEIIANGDLSEPVLITISYNPAELPPGIAEENLYIATKVGDGWEIVPDGFVDTQNHTVNVAVEHFSIFSIFQSVGEVIYDAAETLVGDEITTEYFGDLPDSIRHDFYNLEIKPQDVTAVVHSKLSLTTKASTGLISFGNLISKIGSVAISAVKYTEDLVFTMGELIFAEVGDYATDSQGGSFIVTTYESFDMGREIGKYVYKMKDANPGKAAIQVTNWILAREMEYINANMNPALEGLWKVNTLSASRLDVYAVYFDAVPWQEELGYGARGVKFYYYDDASGKWVNYYNNVFVWKMVFETEETGSEITQETEQAQPTKNTELRPSATPRSTNTQKPAPTNIPMATSAPPTSGEIYVAADGSGDYPTIREAIDAVESGTTIFLDSGTHYERYGISFNKSITLLGAREDLTEVIFTTSSMHFTGPGSLILDGITFRIDHGRILEVTDGELQISNSRLQGGSGGSTIFIHGNSTGSILNSEISNNGSSDCILIQDDAQLLTENNYITECSSGISAWGNSSATIRFNDIRDNDSNGIRLTDSTSTTIEDNTLSDNGRNGIFMEDDTSALIRGNDCSRNGLRGIALWGYEGDTLEATVENNTCNYNENGILFYGTSSGRIQDNECAWNDDYGIEISSSNGSVFLGDNYCHDNGDKDIVDWRDD